MRVFFFSCLFIVTAALRTLEPSEVFLEQPTNTTVKESETATFICSVINSSFEITWLVNGSDAGWSIFDGSGIDIIQSFSTPTVSRLDVEGRLSNNNTKVQCAATLDVPLTLAGSQIALFIVQGEAASNPRVRHTNSLSPTQTKNLHSQASRPSQSYGVVTTQNLKPSSKISTPQTTVSSIISIQSNPTEQNAVFMIVLLGTIVPVIVTILMVLIFTLLIVVISYKKRKVCDRKDVDDISLDPNPVYECKKPIQTQKNELYELSKQIQCQQNSAYDNVVFHQ